MSRLDVISYLERYADAFQAPVSSGVTVLGVEGHETGFRVRTDHGSWDASNVVIATGESQDAWVPDLAQDLSGRIHQVVPTGYRNPGQLPEGGVLVVGASATGIQLAAEIHASGRPVTLSVARHTRLPRTYRGRDILEWFHRMGVLDERTHEVRNLEASRAQPSMQLIGSTTTARWTWVSCSGRVSGSSARPRARAVTRCASPTISWNPWPPPS
jgi:putative flavoprotein involved in K+ transport